MEIKETTKMESNAYYNLPYFVDYLIRQRSKIHSSNINYTIIILSTTIIESLLFDLLNLCIGDSFDLNTMEGRISNDLSNRLNKASWNEFQKITPILLNKKLNDCVDNELWKTIQSLFDYRNEIVHGKPFIVEKSIDGNEVNYSYQGKMKKIFEFLKEKDVIQDQRPGIMTNEIVDFFWLNTKKFILEISSQLKTEENEIVFLMLSDVFKKIEEDKSRI